MDAARRTAYLEVLFHLIIDFRNANAIGYYSQKWNPLWWIRLGRITRRNHLLADAFHNLPYYLIQDGEFDEPWFWELVRKYVPDDYESYKNLFERKLASATSPDQK